MEQDDLNVEIAGVCDIFDVYAKAAQVAASNVHREGTGGHFERTKRFPYLSGDDCRSFDHAIVIAAPDHWHGTIAMAAARAGKECL